MNIIIYYCHLLLFSSLGKISWFEIVYFAIEMNFTIIYHFFLRVINDDFFFDASIVQWISINHLLNIHKYNLYTLYTCMYTLNKIFNKRLQKGLQIDWETLIIWSVLHRSWLIVQLQYEWTSSWLIPLFTLYISSFIR